MKSSLRNHHRKITTLVGSAILSALMLQTASGDDIETLVGMTQDIAGPNITLVVDTSGSMNSEVLIGLDNYDASKDYVGPWDAFEQGGQALRYIFTIPEENGIVIPDETNLDTNNWVAADSFVCNQGLSIIDMGGFYSNRFAQFSIDRDGDVGFWTFPTAVGVGNPGGTNLVECEADYGVHGNGVGEGTYPINLNTLPGDIFSVFPWSTSATAPEAISWSETGSTYTFFSPNFMNWAYIQSQVNGTPIVTTRIQIVKDVMTELIQELTANTESFGDGLRMGLMRFDEDGAGGMVLTPTDDIVDNEAALITEIMNLEADGVTPLAETMYETYLYHAGGPVFFGLGSSPSESISTSFEDGNYISPIVANCQKNFVVLLTDGQPNNDGQADGLIGNLTGPCTNDSCLDEISNYMHTTDLKTGEGFEEEQVVDTFVIGFFTDFQLLEDTATGTITIDDPNSDDPDDTITRSGYILANDREQLKEAFRLAVAEATSNVTTFSAPAVSVNSLNRLTNRDTLYFTMFSPSLQGEPHWDGNLKAYTIGRASAGGDIQILDASGTPAVNTDGTFIDTARSIWSADADGGVVQEGGMASRLSANRNVYSNLSSSKLLTAPGNRVSAENAAAISAATGIMEGDELDELIAFANGLSGDGQARQVLGDPLHSQPLVVNFTPSGGQEDLLLVFGTNDGYLHAINPVAAEGTTNDLEEFAFIPRELMPQLPSLQANPESNFRIESKAYGMDGPISAWIQGDNNNSIVDSGENLFVYAGMRRGGRSYYAFDLTNRSQPKLQFSISPQRAGYSNLGQSWSRLTQGQIRLNDTVRDVLIFGGGYDTNQDGASNSADDMGNSIYIADAITGDLIWSAGGSDTDATLVLPDMTHSIPSDVRIIDVNQDGLIDRLYVGDMAAQVWRFDIDNFAQTGAAPITGGLLADLGTNGNANERRFYSPPSVARFIDADRAFLTVSLGSGFRAHPLDTTIDDRLYVIRDDNVNGPALNTNGVPEYGDVNAELLIDEADLRALTSTEITTEGFEGIEQGSFGKGWFLELGGAGEKNLSPALTVDGRVFFTTYIPSPPGTLTCSPQTASGDGRFYGIDILTGLPALFDDVADGPPRLNILLGPTGIPPEPKLVFVAPDCDGCSGGELPNTSEPVAQIGAQTFGLNLLSRPVRTYWLNFDAE